MDPADPHPALVALLPPNLVSIVMSYLTEHILFVEHGNNPDRSNSTGLLTIEKVALWSPRMLNQKPTPRTLARVFMDTLCTAPISNARRTTMISDLQILLGDVPCVCQRYDPRKQPNPKRQAEEEKSTHVIHCSRVSGDPTKELVPWWIHFGKWIADTSCDDAFLSVDQDPRIWHNTIKCTTLQWEQLQREWRWLLDAALPNLSGTNKNKLWTWLTAPEDPSEIRQSSKRKRSLS